MERLLEYFGWKRVCVTAGLSAVVGTSIYLIRRFRTMEVKGKRICGIDYPKDVVIVHIFAGAGGKAGPGLGHFDVKLQTFLRVNKIPYQTVINPGNAKIGPEKKTPWIEYNGTTMGDSQMIIKFLNKEFAVDMDKHLMKQEKALAWAIQKWMEEFMYWLNMHTRWVLFPDEMFSEGIPPFPVEQKYIFKKWVSGMTYTVGIGRHSKEEVQEMVVENLRKFSDILGEKKFIVGDKMCVVDCAAFGVLSQMRWQTPSVCSGRKLFLGGEIPNVEDYLDRIRDQFWPDYDSPIY